MILMNDFKRDPQPLQDAMLMAAKRVMRSGWYVLGQEVENFESQWAKACGVQFGVGVGNGMDAIEIALRTLEIGSGDEVITTPMSAFATVLAILRTGAHPVLADIEADTGLLSLASAQRCLSSRTKAVVLVHLYGQMDNMPLWVDWCDQNGIALVEDCAQAHLATWKGRCAGSFGRVNAFSFYPTKNLGALGDAGMVVTQDATLARKALRLRNYGQSVMGVHNELGLNSRLDEMQAAILSVRLQWLVEFNHARRVIAKAYREGIQHPMVKMLRPPTDSLSHVNHLFVVTCEARDALQVYLKNCHVQTLIHYRMPVHHQKSCRHLHRDPRGLMNSERHAKTCLSLPCPPHLKSDEVMAVIAAVNAFACK